MGFLLGAAAGAASGLLGAVSGNSQLKKQLNFQREENEKNRQYNRELAEQQNKWNIEQWQRENAYNDPAEMRKRLEAAGYNPNLATSGLSGTLNAAHSPEMTAGAPSNPADLSALGRMDNPATSAMSGALQGIQAEAMTAQTEKTKSETDYQKLLGEYLPAQVRADLNLKKEQAAEIVQRSQNYQFEAERINAEINKLESETNLNKQQGANAVKYGEYMDALRENLDKRLTLDWYKETNFVRLWSKELDIDREKLAEICRQFDFSNGLMSGEVGSPAEMQAELMRTARSLGIKVNEQIESMRWVDFALDKIGQIMDIVSNAVNTFNPAARTTKVIGDVFDTFEESYDENGNTKGSKYTSRRRSQ